MSCGWIAGAISAGALALIGGCVQRNVIVVAPGSTPDSLVFVIRGSVVGSAPTLLFGLSVTRCEDDFPMWTIAADGSRLMPDTLRYGELVPGFMLRVGPVPLPPDCYRAIASGASPVQFAIDPDGRITTEH